MPLDLLGKKSKDNNGENFIHALSVPKLIIIFRPKIENIHELNFNIFFGEELIVLHCPVYVLLYHLSEFLILIYEREVGVQILFGEWALGGLKLEHQELLNFAKLAFLELLVLKNCNHLFIEELSFLLYSYNP